MQLDERELELNQQKKETKKIERALRRQKSSGDTNNGGGNAPMTRKRSWEVRNLENVEDEENRAAAFKGVGSRIAEMEARCSKKLRH